MATASTIYTDAAPKPVGPYSQAIAIGDLIFTAGQIALDPATNTLIEGGVVAQTRLVLSNLAAVLEAGGSSLAKVVKTTVFLVDMNDFAAMNTVYSEFFGTTAPARSCVEAARLPKDVRVEIEAIAYR